MALQGPVHAGSQNEFILGSFTEAQRNALSGVSAGTIIYNTTDSQLNIYDGAWKLIAPGPDGSSGAPFETVAQAQSAGVTEGLYYFKNSNGTSQQLYYDNSDGGWILVSSNNASSSTIPGGQTRHNLAYTLHRNGTNGHLGTPSPDSDYLIGNIINSMSWTTASCKAWGRGTTTAGATTWADKDLGTWIESQANIGSLTGTMARRKVWIQSRDGLSSNGDTAVLDAVSRDNNLNANEDQSTVGYAICNSGDPSEGTYLGHGVNEGSFEGWYNSGNTAADCQGYTTWVR